MRKKEGIVRVEGRELRLSSLDKVLYPETGFTKGQVIDYYARIAPVLLPHLRDRPLTLKRYPNGVGGEFFYEKRAPKYRPAWFRTAAVASAEVLTLKQKLPRESVTASAAVLPRSRKESARAARAPVRGRPSRRRAP